MSVKPASIVLVIMLIACTNTGVILVDPSKSYPPTSNVTLLFEEPTRPYDIIAILEADGGLYATTAQILESARKKAQEVGANAIYILDTQQTYKPAQQVRNFDGSPLTIPGGYTTKVKIAAIRYID